MAYLRARGALCWSAFEAVGVEEPPAQLVSNAIAVTGATRYFRRENSMITISFLQLRNRRKRDYTQQRPGNNSVAR